ncbi:EamA family transporter RarD [Pseudogracilibacillus sp. SE30717A]|uniref:EamA family transporter RarD n=1 Tax=Pseudogracilibacillus sp. SE30717A TaxID=3098293 RepID=UPI00300E6A07
MIKKLSDQSTGVMYTVASFVSWGILPIYWYFLREISTYELFAHRILWSFVFASFILFFIKGWPQVRQVFVHGKMVFWTFIAALLISTNWFIFIWAVTTNHVIEASLGYYINPLFSVALGVIILKERLNRWKVISLFTATVGVFLMSVQFGQIPWIALIIALSFALYGLVKKMVKIDAIVSVTLETMFILPLVLSFLVFIEVEGTSSLSRISLVETLLLLGAGAVTALPLLWFAKGAQHVPLSTLGFLQYINPTLQLLVGIFIFRESFTILHLISFGFIWIALAIFSVSQFNFRQYFSFKIPQRKKCSD